MKQSTLIVGYAGIGVNNNAVAVVIPLANSWKKVDIFTVNSVSRGAVADAANGRLEIIATGDYKANIHAASSSAGANKVYEKSMFELTNPAKVVTGATVANPVVLTVVDHGFSNGDTIAAKDLSGMVEANDRLFTVSAKTDDTFALQDHGTPTDINGGGFTAYTGDGTVHLAVELLAHQHRKFGGAGDVGAAAGGFFHLLTAGNWCEVFALNRTDAVDWTPEYFTALIQRLG